MIDSFLRPYKFVDQHPNCTAIDCTRPTVPRRRHFPKAGCSLGSNVAVAASRGNQVENRAKPVAELLAARLPTRARVAAWIEGQLPRLEEDRQAEQFLRR